MGILDAFLGGKKEEEDLNLDEILREAEMEEEVVEAKMYVRPMQLASSSDYDAVVSELEKGNIVLLNIRPMAGRSAMGVREVVSKLKEYVTSIGGDIARLSEYYIIVTPAGVKIIRRRK